jgi:hypothetical protein
VEVAKSNKSLSHYEKTIEVLDDLHRLSPLEMKKMVEQAMFHVSGLPAEFTDQYKTNQFREVLKYLETLIQFKLKCFFKEQPHLNVQDMPKLDLSRLSILDSDRMIAGVQELFQVAGYFSWLGNFDIKLDKGHLLFTGEISKGLERAQSNRPQIYALYRRLFSKEILLTYELVETNSDSFNLTLHLDFSHDAAKSYFVEVSDENDMLIAFSNVFSNYGLSSDEVKEVGRHLVIEINSDLSVEKTYRLKDKYQTNLSGKEILHFPFLFRPVSLIIPKKGKVFPSNYEKHTGSGDAATRQTSKSFQCHDDSRYIDFFSLLKA